MKKILALVLIVVVTLIFSGCNKQMIGLTYKFDRAIVSLPDGTIVSGKCDSWTGFEDGDQMQVKINGKTYLVHSANCVLIND